MMRFTNKHLISPQQCCFSNKRLTAFNKHQDAASATKKADRIQQTASATKD
jgi:hypothetical protein